MENCYIGRGGGRSGGGSDLGGGRMGKWKMGDRGRVYFLGIRFSDRRIRENMAVDVC